MRAKKGIPPRDVAGFLGAGMTKKSKISDLCGAASDGTERPSLSP